ncbi:hypothetical protein UPYG_G00065390 [Umbra pygmaea]|uniref:Uncharacterized protein n=1 Tax=Umbra pygmaea TaxID=75934 RepID=A0ABD0XAJ1_UMBPY
MKFKDISKLNLRLSMLYAVGIYSLLGAYGYYEYVGRNDEKPAIKAKKEEPPNPKIVTFQSAHLKTTIIYREENFVPYSTRIYNFLTNFKGTTASADSQDSTK